MASIWQVIVYNSSILRLVDLPIVFRSSSFIDFTADSQRPPKFGALAGIVVQLIPKSSTALGSESAPCFSLMRRLNFINSLSDPMKLVPLSENNYFGQPLRDMNLRTAFIVSCVVKLRTMSRCIAFVEKHTNMTT